MPRKVTFKANNLDIIIFNVPSRPGSRFLNNDSKTNRGRTYPPSQDFYTPQVNCEKISAQRLSGVRTENYQLPARDE